MTAPVRSRVPAPDLTNAHVKEAIQAVQDFFVTGLASLASSSPSRYGKVATEAAELGLSAEMLRKARKFASAEDGGYTKAQLERLCRQCKEHGFAIGVSHIIVLLSVSKEHRAGLQKEAIEGHWSRADLEREKKQRFGKRRDTARTPESPRSLEEAYVRLADLCGRWKRIHRSMQFYSMLEGKGRPAAAVDQLPPRLRGMLERVTARIEELEQEVLSTMSRRRRSTQANK